MEYARIRKEEPKMEIETDGMYRRLTHEDLVRMGLDRKGKCRVFFAPFGVRPKKDIYNYVEPDITLICDDEQLEE